MSWHSRIAVASLAAIMVPLSIPAQTEQSSGVLIGGESDRGALLEHLKFTALLKGNRILVIEERSGPFLKMFDASGTLRQRAGRNGAGPGEFRYVAAAALDQSRERLAVFDPALRRASYYSIGDTLRFVGSSALPFEIGGACYLNGQLWVTGDAGNNAIVHRLVDSAGVLTVAQSGGTMRLGHPLDGFARFRWQILNGPIACDSKTGRVIAGTAGLGVIQVVPVKGEPPSLVRLPEFVALEYSAVERGGLMIKRAASGRQDDLIALRLDDNVLRAIVGHQEPAQRAQGEYQSVREFRISAAGVSPGAVARSVERDASAGAVLCTEDAPYPTVRLIRAGRCP